LQAAMGRKRGRVETVTTVTRKTPTKKARRPLARTGGYTGRFSGKGAELKFFDTAISFTIDATGEVPASGQLNLIPQGVTESTRIGRKCTLKSIALNLGMSYSPGAAAVMSDISTIMLVQDTQTNGAAAAIADVLQGGGGTISTAFRNLENSDRFRVLKTWKHTWQPDAGVTTAYNSSRKRIQFFKRCSIPIDFDSTASTGAIGTIRSNNVFLLAGTDGGSDDLITVYGNCRLRFSDR